MTISLTAQPRPSLAAQSYSIARSENQTNILSADSKTNQILLISLPSLFICNVIRINQQISTSIRIYKTIVH